MFAERTSPELYMSRLQLADLFLDTVPYNAGTIASDAIRMQLPLLTLCGRSFASRMAGPLLSLIGATEGVTTSVSEYVETAVTLATDRHAYAAYKRHFVGDAWASTAGDNARFTTEFEASLELLVKGRPMQATAAGSRPLQHLREQHLIPLAPLAAFGRDASVISRSI